MIVARRSVVAAIVSLILASSVCLAKADYIPPCTPPQGVVSVPLERVPPALMQALRNNVGEIVGPGEKFDATDVVWTGRSRRFIFVWSAGKRWIVATEHGGLGYNDPVFVYHLGEDERSAVLMAQEIAFPNNVCAVASGLTVER